MTLNDLMLMADEYADSRTEFSRAALVTALRTALPQQTPHRVALTGRQMDALHKKLGGKPERPTYNPGKVKPDWSAA